MFKLDMITDPETYARDKIEKFDVGEANESCQLLEVSLKKTFFIFHPRGSIKQAQNPPKEVCEHPHCTSLHLIALHCTSLHCNTGSNSQFAR